jgi:hypothetical protein
MDRLVNTNTIPDTIPPATAWLSTSTALKIQKEKEETDPLTYPMGRIEANTSVLICPPEEVPEELRRINIAEAYTAAIVYITAIQDLSIDFKRFIGNNVLDWAIAYNSDDLTRSILANIEIPTETSRILDDRVDIIEPDKVRRFCEEHGLEEAFNTYIDEISRVFQKANRITISLASDPEIEERKKIKLAISIKSDIETVSNLDEELFKTIDANIPDRDSDYFVEVYDLIE